MWRIHICWACCITQRRLMRSPLCEMHSNYTKRHYGQSTLGDRFRLKNAIITNGQLIHFASLDADLKKRKIVGERNRRCSFDDVMMIEISPIL
jgi:hypothetical protein